MSDEAGGMASLLVLGIVIFICYRSCGSKDSKSPEDACSKAIEQYQDSIFPKDRFVETEGWIAPILKGLGMNTDDLDRQVANYEVGRFQAAQIALGEAGKWSICKTGAAN